MEKFAISINESKTGSKLVKDVFFILTCSFPKVFEWFIENVTQIYSITTENNFIYIQQTKKFVSVSTVFEKLLPLLVHS